MEGAARSMRAARLVGLSQDGQSLIVATESGDELALAADDRLRAALRGDRPRLGQLEIEMESALSPREIQTRIRSGDSLEDVARVANMPLDRVERFAAPVLAEREHIASLAMTASVRRRGETSGHRGLRTVLHERLEGRGIDLDTLQWDAYRLADGRWGVTADYASGEGVRTAEFLFDLQGRFSVAANDDARWVLAEQAPGRGSQADRRRPESGEDTEPTVDLSDELALVRAVQDPVRIAAAQDRDETHGPIPATADDNEPTLAIVRTLRVEVDEVVLAPTAHTDDATEDETADETADETEPEDEVGGLDTLYALLDEGNAGPDPATEPTGPVEITDAAAVPDGLAPPDAEGWEPSIVVDYPVEPGVEDDPDGDQADGPSEQPLALADRSDERAEQAEDLQEAAAEEAAVEAAAAPPAPAEPDTAIHASEPEPEPDSPIDTLFETDPVEVAPRPANRRKRASVPSWDEIMFGGPKKD